MIESYPKIYALGHRVNANIFTSSVEITEKVDGSQFGFGKINGELHCRSKGKAIDLDNPEKLFIPAVEYVTSMLDHIPEGTCFYTEYLQKPKHNVLAYERIPKNHLALFGANSAGGWVDDYPILTSLASRLDIDVVPLVYIGRLKDALAEIPTMLERESLLGKEKIEGVVVKNYQLRDPYTPYAPLTGKFVAERFKERHKKDPQWKTSKTNWTEFCQSFCREARWEKAIQHLRESGDLTESPKDIGALIQEVQQDIIDEEKEAIMEFLWKIHHKDVLKTVIRGLPDWYKHKLLENCQ